MPPEAADRGARLDTLVDGVMAIVVTLLVLDLRLPEGIGAMDSAGVWAALHGMREQLVSYLFSFLVTALLWLSHVHLPRGGPVGRSRIWLSFAFLASVALIPFATALLSRSGSAAATMVYAGVMALASSALGVLALLAESGRRGRPGAGDVVSHLAVPAVFLLSIAVAAWHAPGARLTWLVVGLLPLLERRRGREGPDQSPKETTR